MSKTSTNANELVPGPMGLPVVLGFLAFSFLAASAIEMRDTPRQDTQQGATALAHSETDSERLVFRIYTQCSGSLRHRDADCSAYTLRTAVAAGVQPELVGQHLKRIHTGATVR